jgi:hypothetical protein
VWVDCVVKNFPATFAEHARAGAFAAEVALVKQARLKALHHPLFTKWPYGFRLVLN